MLIIHGVYHFKPKPVAVRDDFCIQCRAHRAAVRVKTLDVLHIFWIPMIPLGRYRRWRCISCGQDPAAVRTARRSIKIVAAMLTAAIAAVLWLNPEGSTEAWIARVAFTLAAAGSVWWLAAGSEDIERRKRLEALPPNHTPECPFCQIRMLPDDPWRCPKCGIVRA